MGKGTSKGSGVTLGSKEAGSDPLGIPVEDWSRLQDGLPLRTQCQGPGTGLTLSTSIRPQKSLVRNVHFGSLKSNLTQRPCQWLLSPTAVVRRAGRGRARPRVRPHPTCLTTAEPRTPRAEGSRLCTRTLAHTVTWGSHSDHGGHTHGQGAELQRTPTAQRVPHRVLCPTPLCSPFSGHRAPQGEPRPPHCQAPVQKGPAGEGPAPAVGGRGQPCPDQQPGRGGLLRATFHSAA